MRHNCGNFKGSAQENLIEIQGVPNWFLHFQMVVTQEQKIVQCRICKKKSLKSNILDRRSKGLPPSTFFIQGYAKVSICCRHCACTTFTTPLMAVIFLET